MKRKIAAIFAADVAGYSRLVAEDEEETLRRLASYRAVMDDFIARAGGRIFNTAGDAVLAEFPSAVEAVRCAIDIQESLRTRNMAYPASRQMSFRIGITVGDVVERDGDLLGDGVNIAARLEGIAPVGGICISRSVHEQVANKLSVHFADIGEQQVKNIPNPVHAYHIAMRPDDAQTEAAPRKPMYRAPWRVPGAIAAGCFAVLAAGGLGYLIAAKPQPSATAQKSVQAIPAPAAPAPLAVPAPHPVPAIAPIPTPSPAAPAPTPAASTASRASEVLTPDTIPFIPDRARNAIRDEYLTAADHKALAIGTGPIGMSTGQTDDAAAKNAALDLCQSRADALPVRRKCEIYAIGNMVVYARGRPPMPPAPWVVRDAAIEHPLAPGELPLVQEGGKMRIQNNYLPGRGPKALALGPNGGFFYYFNQDSVDEAERRSLELCGMSAGVPCQIVAVDNMLVVPVPTTMKAVGLFRSAGTAAIAPELREDVKQRLAGSRGWSAVAIGDTGKAGLARDAASEQVAVDAALNDCASKDRGCHVIAIGPFTVEPK